MSLPSGLSWGGGVGGAGTGGRTSAAAGISSGVAMVTSGGMVLRLGLTQLAPWSSGSLIRGFCGPSTPLGCSENLRHEKATGSDRCNWSNWGSRPVGNSPSCSQAQEKTW